MAKKPSVDRRNFLKTAAVTGAAALTAGSGIGGGPATRSLGAGARSHAAARNRSGA